MPRLSQTAIERCSNIALAIDEELKKEFKDRKSIFIKAFNPRTLKGELAAYKTQFKKEWLTQFWMLVHDSRVRNSKDHAQYGTCLEISFVEHNRKKIEYEIIRPNEDHIEIYKQDIGEIGLSSFTLTPVSDMNDTVAAQYILMEMPDRMKLELSSLSDETKEWFNDQNQDPSPLLKMIQKRGYFFTIRGQYLWITKEYDSSLA